jgi:CubicO group peptidase (beta-lactamase class C family)
VALRNSAIVVFVLLCAGAAQGGAKSKADAVLAGHHDWWARWIVVGVITPDDDGVFYYTRDDFLPPKPNTAFRIGSISKTVTATLLALQNGTPDMSVGRCENKLKLGGRRSLLAPVLAKACPTCSRRKDSQLPESRETITIEQLATHHSGLAHKATTPACNTAEFYATVTKMTVDTSGDEGCAKGTDPFSAEELPRQEGCSRRSLCFPTNDRYNYSNWGYDLLGPLLAFNAGYGEDFNRLARDKVFGPLGMTRSFSNDETLAFNAVERAASWNCEAGPCQLQTHRPPASAEFSKHGSANFWSTGEDMLRYLRFAMGATRLPAALRDARELIFCDRGEGKGSGQTGLAWNHGTITKKYDPSNPDDLVWEKSGEAADFHAYIAFSPQKGVGVFVLANASTDSPGSIGKTILGSYPLRKRAVTTQKLP